MSASPAIASPTATDTPPTLNCGSGGGSETYTNLRIASIFIVLCASMSGALFPVLAKRSSWLKVPTGVFNFAKYFGSGVIIATAFIHLLSPALDELGSPCLSEAWQSYPYALAICLASIFAIFIVELFAFRVGSAHLAKLGLHHDPHGHGIESGGGSHAAHGPEGFHNHGSPQPIAKSVGDLEAGDETSRTRIELPDTDDLSKSKQHQHYPAIAQILGIAILEFGIVLHSVLIGLTLAVDESFKILFVVIVFHQLFEGLGLGSRLAFINLPAPYSKVPIYAAILYGLTTPIGIAIGLGVRASYNPGSTEASIVSGVMDAVSSGILIYTGLVELLAHEFLFNGEMINASNGKLLYALGCMCAGCGLMALLGKWA
ncbi:hypothetical protein JAAARDRAFT_676449 [Jaapia argillacea MUCL 33604]|uniref:ZIP-like iron-zinc transporter n=1 Tax=Jaapia argillacea MUCL 33604 TaxID=933084 RepID=A0A067PVC8_9AGAM|nr:hypothetical protein JAAARDRAFT_676449 [Jaapia argillacea MUCL 33604]